MHEWDTNQNTSSYQYPDDEEPALNFDDVQRILGGQDRGSLLVLCRKMEGEELGSKIIGYSFSYPESSEDKSESLYIAELWISPDERGCGFGALLLAQTLSVKSAQSCCCSHLYGCGRNVGAVRLYLKFGYQGVQKPSGDPTHNLIMELQNREESVVHATQRFEQKLTAAGPVGERKSTSSSACHPTPHLHRQPEDLHGPVAERVLAAAAERVQNGENAGGGSESAGVPASGERHVGGGESAGEGGQRSGGGDHAAPILRRTNRITAPLHSYVSEALDSEDDDSESYAEEATGQCKVRFTPITARA
jgi:GNAT superfamily N-acetyltransferase